jgi:3-phosphoshikimate 1-carboxyvinyltransferase
MCAAAFLVPGSEVIMPSVSLNPGRAGFLTVLRRMGADITIEEPLTMGEEPTATLIARHGRPLCGTTVVADEVPALIDEVPVLALVATQAEGVTRFEGIGELRVKESDRLELVSAGLRKLGAHVEIGSDWLEVHGPCALHGATLSASGDHRLAMMWAVAGLIAEGATVIEGFEVIDVSYPAFADDLQRLRGEA